MGGWREGSGQALFGTDAVNGHQDTDRSIGRTCRGGSEDGIMLVAANLDAGLVYQRNV